MNKRNTILIAVLINAGVLAALFIAAVSTKEEVGAEMLAHADTPMPLYTEPVEIPLAAPAAAPALAAEGAPVVGAPESPLGGAAPVVEATPPAVHNLPPLAPLVVESGSSAPAPAATAPVAASVEPAYKEVTVKKGDSLEKIARAHQTTVDEIVRLNQLPSHFLQVGQKLKVPKGGVKSVAARGKEAGPEYYTVKVGDNPWTIAKKHNLKVEELLKLNGLNEQRARKLKPGERLRVK
jgi:LysM repeat protein